MLGFTGVALFMEQCTMQCQGQGDANAEETSQA